MPSDRWRRPSDYVAHVAAKFESEWVNPKTGRRTPRPLKRDQVLFVAQFAAACNAVWEDEQKVLDGSLEAKNRRRFNFFVTGQAGSGKTAVVQDICMPTVDFLFPPGAGEESSVLVVCSKWSQAEIYQLRHTKR